MSTKTIAIDARVYERLASVKREGESFSKAIDRLLAEIGSVYTGGEILRGLATFAPLSKEDSDVFLQVIAGNRASEDWAENDLP